MQIGNGRYVVAVLVGVLTIAACGSDGPKTVSRSEFVAKADAICRASDAKVSALYERLGEPQGDAAILTLVHQAADIQLSALNRAREIGQPDSGAASVERLFDAAEAEFTAAKSAASRARCRPNGQEPRRNPPAHPGMGLQVLRRTRLK